MFTLKRLSRDAVAAALEKALRYRLLNEPGEAESICLDVLAVDAGNQEALATLLLALTDRFDKGYGVSDTQIHEVLDRIPGEYERAYYSGIVCERRGKAALGQGAPGSRHTAYEWFEDAMQWFEKAEVLRPEGNDDALLRWNACARMIVRNKLTRRVDDPVEHPLE